MHSELLHRVIDMIETEVRSRPSPIEFEMAYQARVAIDRIRFAIKHTEQFGPRTDQMHETGLQLLDALQRLETADRKFQERSRSNSELRRGGTELAPEANDGTQEKSSDGRTRDAQALSDSVREKARD